MIKESEFENVCGFIAGRLLISINDVKKIIIAYKVNEPDIAIYNDTRLPMSIIERCRKLYDEFDDAEMAGAPK